MSKVRINGNQIIIDGQTLSEENHEHGILSSEEKERIWRVLGIERKETLKLLLDCPISDLRNIADRIYTSFLTSQDTLTEITKVIPELSNLPFLFTIEGILFDKEVPVYISDKNRQFLNVKAEDYNMLSLGVYFLDHSNWKHPFTPNEFLSEFLSIYPSLENEFFIDPYSSEYYFKFDPFERIGLALKPNTCQQSLRDILLELLEHMIRSHELAIKNVYSRMSPNALIEYFAFPGETKTACIQYLQYFYDFLKEIGVEAKVRLDEQDSGATVLSVIPEDKDEALENIRLALDIYLRLPSSRVEADMSSISVQSLNAQIFHLKGQLALAAATIQQQQSAIQNLQIQQPFSPDVLVFSQQGESKDQEPLLGGIIKVGEAELAEGALSINLAVLLRWLKKKMRMSRSEG